MNDELMIVYRIGFANFIPSSRLGNEICETTNECFFDWLKETERVLGTISIVLTQILNRGQIKGEISNVG